MRRSKTPNLKRIHIEKIYRYNGANDNFISLSEIRVEKIQDGEKKRTVRHVIHRDVYPRDTVVVPLFVTVGKIYRCIKVKGRLTLVPYRAKSEKRYQTRITLTQIGYSLLLIFGLCVIFLMKYNFTTEIDKKELTLICIGTLGSAITCFVISKIIEYKGHKREAQLITEITQ